MANLPESATYDAGVYQLETTDPVLGGESGVSNTPLKNLANRTKYLKQHVDALEAAASGNAPVDSPTFTGDPKGPTAAAGDNDTSLATTAFVARLHGGLLSKSVAGGVNVTLTTAEAGYGIISLTGTITANIAVIFPSAAGRWIVVNGTAGSFTVTCKTAAGTGVTVKQGKSREIFCNATNVYASESDFENVALTGTPTAPTATPGTINTQVTNAAFLQQTVYGVVTKDVAGGSTTAMTSSEVGNGVLLFTGTLTADKAVTVPAQAKSWIVVNNCEGAYSLTLKTPSGTGVVLPKDQAVFAYCDGTNVGLAGSANQNTLSITKITATASQTNFSVEYTPGALLVFKNGGYLDASEYTATSGSLVVLGTGATVDDELVFVAFATFEVGSGGSGSSFTPSIKTSSFTAEANNLYFVDVTSGPVTVTMPGSPSLGDPVKIIHYKGDITSNNITVGRNGQNIMATAEDMTVALTNATVTLRYSDSGQGWRLDNL